MAVCFSSLRPIKPMAVAATAIALLLHVAPPATAQALEPAPQFRQIEQPLALKLGVTLAGVGLIGLELWWFLLSQPQPQPPSDDR